MSRSCMSFLGSLFICLSLAYGDEQIFLGFILKLNTAASEPVLIRGPDTVHFTKHQVPWSMLVGENLKLS